jgi:uncharacterized membrane protein YbhN (UPF0104 family)
VLFNLRVYVAGLALTTSPGKVAETIRSVLLLPRGVSIVHSLAAFFADRLSDVIGVAILGATAGCIVATRNVGLEIIGAAALCLSFIARAVIRSGCCTTRIKQVPGRIGAWLTRIHTLASAWAGLWTLPRALMCAFCAFVAFGIQGCVFAFFVALSQVSLPTAQCVAMFASATLIGAASMIPAGLGATEAALVFQLMNFGVDATTAVALAIITRLVTLWCGLLLGSVTLLSFVPARVDRRAIDTVSGGREQ